MTLNGLLSIAALTVGTPVLAFNEQTGENGYYPITQVHRNQDPAITYLTINDPEQGNKPEFITTTPEHPFYLQQASDTKTRPKPEGHADLSSKWVGAGHLKIGDKIKQADGTIGVIANVVTTQQTREMFNLTVDTAHTFYVGANGWLVHNCEPYSNLMPDSYAAEAQLAKRLGVKPLSAGSKAFDELIDSAEPIKYVITTDGKISFVPVSKNGNEISHAVAASGKDVISAGTVNVSGSKSIGYYITELTNGSGHYQPGRASLSIAERYFRDAGFNILDGAAVPHPASR